VTPDITQPLDKAGGVVVEVNAGPSLLMHLNPAEGQARDVGQAIAEHLFPSQSDGRIPVVGFMGAGDTTRTAKLTAWLLHLQGWTTGLSCADGLYLNQRCLQEKGGMDFGNAERLLVNRSVQAAVFETDPLHLLTEGLPYDRCQVGVVTSMPGTAGLPAELYAGDDDRMPGYIRTQIDVVLPTGTAVLNAENDLVAELADYCDGDVLFYASSEQHPRIAEHRAQGKRVAFWREGLLVLAKGAQETEVLSSQRPAVAKLLKEGRFDSGNILVAACVAWALDIPAELIRAGVKSYGQSPSSF